MAWCSCGLRRPALGAGSSSNATSISRRRVTFVTFFFHPSLRTTAHWAPLHPPSRRHSTHTLPLGDYNGRWPRLTDSLHAIPSSFVVSAVLIGKATSAHLASCSGCRVTRQAGNTSAPRPRVAHGRRPHVCPGPRRHALFSNNTVHVVSSCRR
jgi:hypothetical protein